jgi:hypothetical protein
LHAETRAQKPPWQLVEQHSKSAAQAFPSVVQVETPPEGTAAQTFPLQIPEQHCAAVPAVQGAPRTLHAPAPPHVPELHWPVQHSVGDAHASPSPLQNSAVVHFPESPQYSEQHSSPLVQVSPPSLHAPAIGGTQWPVPSQSPEQHIESAEQAPVFRHEGSTQYPLSPHLFVQQFESEPQACPTSLQPPGPGTTQVPLQALLQHSDGVAQGAPFAEQPCAPHVPPALHCCEQHSPAALQIAPSLLQFCVASQKPLGHDPEQHSEADRHSAPTARHAVLGESDEDELLHAAPERTARQIARPANA